MGRNGEEVKWPHIETGRKDRLSPGNCLIMVQSDVSVDKGYCLTNLHLIPGTHGKVGGEN